MPPQVELATVVMGEKETGGILRMAEAGGGNANPDTEDHWRVSTH